MFQAKPSSQNAGFELVEISAGGTAIPRYGEGCSTAVCAVLPERINSFLCIYCVGVYVWPHSQRFGSRAVEVHGPGGILVGGCGVRVFQKNVAPSAAPGKTVCRSKRQASAVAKKSSVLPK